MSSIRCPLCDDRISGDETSLGPLLSDHFREVHQVTSSSGHTFHEHRGPVSEGGKLHQAEIRREEQAWSPAPGAPVPQRPEGLGDWFRKAAGIDRPPSEGGEWTTGEGYPTMMDRDRPDGSPHPSSGKVREEVMDSITCPLCGEMIDGRGEDALTERYREHIGTVHRLVTTVKER